MAYCKEEGLKYRTVYNALRLAEAVDQAVAEGRFRPEDLAKYGWNQALRTFGVKLLKQATAEEEDATEGVVKAEVEETTPRSHPVADSEATATANTKRRSGGGSHRTKRRGKGDSQKGRSKDDNQGQEKKLPDLPHIAAEKEVGLFYPPRELCYQSWHILQDVAARADSIDWKQEDVDDWQDSLSEMRDSLQQIEEKALDRTTKGETTANQELGQTKKEPKVVAGDRIYEVEPYSVAVPGSPRIFEHEVRKVDTLSYACADGTRVHKVDAFSPLIAAKTQRTKLLQDEITDREADLKRLKAALKQEPTIVPEKKESHG
jgi:hypothetical protein